MCKCLLVANHGKKCGCGIIGFTKLRQKHKFCILEKEEHVSVKTFKAILGFQVASVVNNMEGGSREERCPDRSDRTLWIWELPTQYTDKYNIKNTVVGGAVGPVDIVPHWSQPLKILFPFSSVFLKSFLFFLRKDRCLTKQHYYACFSLVFMCALTHWTRLDQWKAHSVFGEVKHDMRDRLRV